MTTERYQGTVWTLVPQGDIAPSLRINPPYFEDQFLEVQERLLRGHTKPLNRFIPEEHPDGAKGITYGQVGARKLTPRGSVRYLQVINIRETGIDFAIKPDRVAERSHNDPPRSRVRERDILLTNTAFRGTETLIGRCVVVHRDYGKVNISQDIDRIRVAGVNPYYVGAFLKSPLGQLQLLRRVHGVDSQKINFGQIRSMLIPDLAEDQQNEVERQYLGMAAFHDRAMAIKERLLDETGVEPGQYGQTINALADERPEYRNALSEAKARLDHLITQLIAVLDGRQNRLLRFGS